MSKKLYISEQEIKEIVVRDKEEWDKFAKKHIFNTSDPLVLVLKTHLFVENLLNQMICFILPKPFKTLKKRFSDKLDFVEALGIDGWSKNNIIEKIRILNSIRNEFSHNLEYELEENDINQLSESPCLDKNIKKTERLKLALCGLLGSLHSIKTLYELFPFVLFMYNYEEIFKRDKGFSKVDIMATYPMKDLSDILGKMKCE